MKRRRQSKRVRGAAPGNVGPTSAHHIRLFPLGSSSAICVSLFPTAPATGTNGALQESLRRSTAAAPLPPGLAFQGTPSEASGRRGSE